MDSSVVTTPTTCPVCKANREKQLLLTFCQSCSPIISAKPSPPLPHDIKSLEAILESDSEIIQMANTIKLKIKGRNKLQNTDDRSLVKGLSKIK